MSGSLRELSKVIAAEILSADTSSICDVSPDIPDSITNAIAVYLGRHPRPDTADAQRLHDDLQRILRKHVVADSAAEALFIKSLALLVPILIVSPDRLKWWIQQIMVTALSSLGRSRTVVKEARDVIFGITVFDAFDSSVESSIYEPISQFTADALVQVYLGLRRLDTDDSLLVSADAESDSRAMCVKNADLELRRFGYKRPLAFFAILDRYFVQRQHRVKILGLLCTYIQTQPPYLFETRNSSLITHLYECLSKDLSALAVNLACTVFVMYLPHVCSSLGGELPKIFAIYARLLYWDLLYDRKSDSGTPVVNVLSSGSSMNGHGPNNSGYSYYTSEDDSKPASGDNSVSWDILEALPKNDYGEVTTVNYSRLYTFIYGLYPIHFLTFLTNPSRYFKLIGLRMSDFIKFDVKYIAIKSQDLSKRHLLHPNLIRYTFTSEILDQTRWEIAGAADDIAAYCLTLDTKDLQPPSPMSPAIYRKLVGDAEQSSFDATDHDGYGEQSFSFGDNIVSSDHQLSQSTSSREVRKPDSVQVNDLSGESSQAEDSKQMAPSPKSAVRGMSPVPSESSRRAEINSILQNHMDSSDLYTSRSYLEGNSVVNSPAPSVHLSGQFTNSGAFSLPPPLSRVNSADADGSSAPPTRSFTDNSPVLNFDSDFSGSQLQQAVTSLEHKIVDLQNELNFERYLKQLRLRNLRQIKTQYTELQRAETNNQGLIFMNRELQAKIQRIEKESAAELARTVHQANIRANDANKSYDRVKLLREEQNKWREEKIAQTKQLTQAHKEIDLLKGSFLFQEAKIEDLSRQLSHALSRADEAESLQRAYYELQQRMQIASIGVESRLTNRENEDAQRLRIDLVKVLKELEVCEASAAKQKLDFAIVYSDLRKQIANLSKGGDGV
ncbi:Hamartin protein-domain-containing protein [Limtongia smithiae]|uniref:Hamartin protein-domain-containing protein n=1 Tax=Limtongia smithiae TaxID=1125753 RepID=UPI0034D0091D